MFMDQDDQAATTWEWCPTYEQAANKPDPDCQTAIAPKDQC